MGSYWTFFPSCIIHTAGRKKLKILQLFIIRVAITGSNWSRKLVLKAHVAGSILFRSHAYFPEWKSVFIHLKMAMIDKIKSDQSREQTDVGLSKSIAHQISSC